MARYGGNDNDGGGGEKCPPGFYRAALVGVFDVGAQPGFNPGDQPNHKVMLIWEIDRRDSKGRPFLIFDSVAAFLSTKPSKFSERVGSLRGRPLSEAECKAGIDDSEILGKTAMAFVAPPSGSGKWPKIAQTVPLQEQPPLRPETIYTESNAPKPVATMRGKAVGGWPPPPKGTPAPAPSTPQPSAPREPGDEEALYGPHPF